MLAAMTHPSRVLNLDMKAKLCMPKSYICIYFIYIYIYCYDHPAQDDIVGKTGDLMIFAQKKIPNERK